MASEPVLSMKAVGGESGLWSTLYVVHQATHDHDVSQIIYIYRQHPSIVLDADARLMLQVARTLPVGLMLNVRFF